MTACCGLRHEDQRTLCVIPSVITSGTFMWRMGAHVGQKGLGVFPCEYLQDPQDTWLIMCETHLCSTINEKFCLFIIV